MAFREHRTFIALGGAGAFATAHDALSLDVTATRLSVRIRYTKGVGSADGYPGFRVRWYFPGALEALATVRSGSLTIAAGQPTAEIVERIGVIHCEDVRDGTNAVTVRELDVPPGAYAVKIEACEVGDTANPGNLGIHLGGVQ